MSRRGDVPCVVEGRLVAKRGTRSGTQNALREIETICIVATAQLRDALKYEQK
jgi:hypothetical protein